MKKPIILFFVVLLLNVSLCPAKDGPGNRVFQDNWIEDQVVFTQHTGGKGGAVQAMQAFVRLRDARFEKNNALEGGAVHSREATVVLLGGNFVQNFARTGGALFNNESKIVANGVSFIGNTTDIDGDGGAAIYNRQGTIILHDAVFRDNDADSQKGGAIVNDQGSVIAVDTDFEKNRARRGGGVSNFQGTVVADRATFDSNSALDAGGAIDCFQGTVILRDCDFLDNTVSDGRGAALRLFQAKALIEVDEDFRTLFSGNLDPSGANSVYIESAGSLEINVAKDGILDMRDPIDARSDRGNVTVTKKGEGVWKLGGVNRFAGPAEIRIEQGTIYLYRDGEVGNANPKAPNAVVQAGQILLEDENSSLTFREGCLDAGNDNVIKAKKIRFAKGSSIRFPASEASEGEATVLRFHGNVGFDGAVVQLRCYENNRCDSIAVDGEVNSVKFNCIEISDAKPGTYAVLRAERGIRSIVPGDVCARAPGFKVNYEIVDDGKQLNLTLSELSHEKTTKKIITNKKRGRK